MSKKMIQSFNIRNRTGISVHNSKTFTIYDIILDEDTYKIKNLLLNLGIRIFRKYLERITRNHNYNDTKKSRIINIYNTILANLTIEEQKSLGIYVTPPNNITLTETQERIQQTSNIYFKYFCSVWKSYDQSHIVITNLRQKSYLIPGKKYLFDLSNETNNGHQLSFSQEQFKFVDAPGLYFAKNNGSIIPPGTTGACIVYTVPLDIDIYNIWLYDKNDNTSNSFFYFPYVNKSLIIKLNYLHPTKGGLNITINQDEILNEINCIDKSMTLRSLESDGPKYVIEPNDINYFNREGFDIRNRYKPNVRYGLHYGSYNLYINNRFNPFTLLNKGKEHLIKITGDNDKKSTIYLEYLDADNTLSGNYDFYHGNVTIEVYGDFGTIAFYSKIYGINRMDNYFTFSDTCYDKSTANTNYTIKSSEHIECIQPQTKFNLEYQQFTESLITHISSNGSGDTIKNIRSIISNETISFEVPQYITQTLYYFSYNNMAHIGSFILEDLSYDYILSNDTNNYNYYVTFDDINSQYQFYNTSDIVNENPINNLTLYRGKVYSFTGVNITLNNQFNIGSSWRLNLNEIFINIPYLNFNYGNSLAFNINKKYGLYNGQYMIFNIPEEHPIAFINKGKEEYLYYEGISRNSFRRLGPDNQLYNFYYGKIILYVRGDFGQISVYDFYNGYLNSKFILIYTDVCDYSDYHGTSQWQPDNGYIDISSSYESIIENNYNELQYHETITFEDYMFFNIRSDKIILTDIQKENNEYIDYKENALYTLNTGNYVLLNVPINKPIAFLNNGIEHLFEYSGYFPFSTQSIGPDGNTYTFYYGSINIIVHGDFGKISIYILSSEEGSFGGFLNGQKLFIHSTDSHIGKAIIQNTLNSAYPNIIGSSYELSIQKFYLDVSIYEEKLPYSGSNISYNFFGIDRNGLVNKNENNPTLTFFLGDIVHFSFLYNNGEYTFGIYQGSQLERNPQTIENNANTNKLQIKWQPVTTNYYYRSLQESDLVFGLINIINNGLVDIHLNVDISNIYPAYDISNISIELSQFSISFDEIVNINPTQNFELYKLNYSNLNYELDRTYKGSQFNGSGSKRLSLNTNFNRLNRLEFNTSYIVKISNNLFKNIYNNSLSSPYYYDENNNILNINEEDYLYKFKTELKHDPKLLSIEYLDNSDNIYKPLTSSSYINSGGELIDVSGHDILFNLSGQLRLTFNESIQYLYNDTEGGTNFGYPYFTTYDGTISVGTLTTSVSGEQLILNFTESSSLGLTYNNAYKLIIKEGSVTDLNYVPFEVDNSSFFSNPFFLKMIPDPRPLLQSIIPDYGQTGVPVNSNFSLTFDKPVYPGILGTITIYNFDITNMNLNTNLVFDQFNFADQADIDAITGWGTTTLTFRNSAAIENFNFLSGYTLQIESTVIRTSNTSNDYYVGFDPMADANNIYFFRTVTSST